MATIDSSETMQVWSLNAEADGAGQAKALLSQLHKLTRDDFGFVRGPFADPNRTTPSPVAKCLAFFPSFTVLGMQPFFVVGLSSGDILKCPTGTGTVPWGPHLKRK
eukprot:m.217919 g.217919  ORF g.217919 m.217919 type:complete len:106 (-) comp10788_c7_seq15:1264-1581(-)